MLIRRVGDRQWREPTDPSFAREQALQTLLEKSPELLPGAGGMPLVIATEVQIPGTGPVDVIAVAPDGSIFLIECKLRANPEIRRRVVGQILAYASGLWQLPYELFADAMRKRIGQDLLAAAEQKADEGSVGFDEDGFRLAVGANLAAGRFRLVVAVDEATDELKRTVEYLNSHTDNNVPVLVLGLRYMRDGDVEILDPSVYGEEAVQRKVEPARRGARAIAYEQAAFWATALPRLASVVAGFGRKKPGDYLRIGVSSGRMGINYAVGIQQNDCDCGLVILGGKFGDSSLPFDELRAMSGQIESTFGGKLSWTTDGQKRRIKSKIEGGGYLDREAWPRIQDELVDRLTRLRVAMEGPLKAVQSRPPDPDIQ